MQGYFFEKTILSDLEIMQEFLASSKNLATHHLFQYNREFLFLVLELSSAHSEAVPRRCSVKKVFLQNSQENTCARACVERGPAQVLSFGF